MRALVRLSWVCCIQVPSELDFFVFPLQPFFEAMNITSPHVIPVILCQITFFSNRQVSKAAQVILYLILPDIY